MPFLSQEHPMPRSEKPDPKQRQEAAVALAIAALSFIAGEPERLGRFLAMTGIGPESIRASAREPHFLLGVLDYLASDEPLLIEFANQNGFDPEHVTRARDVLAGPAAGSDWR
jgi:Protein of unknown function (DUF3572)